MMKLYKLISVVSLSWFATNFAVAAEPMGRLFSTPAERSQLELLRQIPKKLVPIVNEVQPIAIKRIVLPKPISVQGYVKRNDGKDGTVWINGEAVQESSRNKGIKVGKLPANSNKVPIKIQANGKRISLKAGQVYDPAQNSISESRTSVQGDVGTIGD